MKLFIILILCCPLLAFQSSCTPTQPERPQLMQAGWLEQVQVGPKKMLMHAKLDSGADSCSIHADDPEIFKSAKNKDRIKFTIANRYGQKQKLNLKIEKYIKIKTKDGGFQTRPVVKIPLCLAGSYEVTECNLVNRSNFEYPVLIGRNFLAGTTLVNSSETYLTEPNCVSNE